MPIFSYLAIPEKNAVDEMCAELEATPHCEVITADKKEVVILVTDTPDNDTEEKLQQQLKNIKSLQSLSMTFGHADEELTREAQG
ncbi:MAG: chaperone NapD [Desulfobulbaceae bacterium]|nr:chaperone NapD [Desulfobulbaceae bacterium]HIJ78164.1 hypothetical protein [Deltaproteobacteria bacterium]